MRSTLLLAATLAPLLAYPAGAAMPPSNWTGALATEARTAPPLPGAWTEIPLGYRDPSLLAPPTLRWFTRDLSPRWFTRVGDTLTLGAPEKIETVPKERPVLFGTGTHASQAGDLVTTGSLGPSRLDGAFHTFTIPVATRPAAEAITPTTASPPPASIGIEPVANAAEPTILLPTGEDVGLAAFRLGAETLIVLDAPVDFQAVSPDIPPAFARLTSHRTQDATVIRIPTEAGTLHLARNAKGWLVTTGTPRETLAGIVPQPIKNGPNTTSIRLRASEASRVVTVVDPDTGDHFLVGTQRIAGQAVPNEQRQVQFKLLPTMQGIALAAATTDDIWLRREAGGFTISAGPNAGGTIIWSAPPPDPNAPVSQVGSKLFDFPNDTPQVLARQLRQRILTAANAPVLARSAPRLRVAEAMVALGMDVEAQAVLDVAAAADPAFKDVPRVIALRGIASVLAHRLDDAETLSDPRLSGTTEVELWRALLQVAKNQVSREDAFRLSTGLPLLLSYPRTLRDRVLPEALEAMALNGEAEAAQIALNALSGDLSLDLARGIVLEMTNRPADAMRTYDQVAARSDRLPRYKALVRAVELRIMSGELGTKTGADALDRALYAWRGDNRELALRMRIADLRQQAGQWREALTVLRDGRGASPEDRAQLDPKMAAIFTTFLADDAARRMAPSEFVALYDQNLDLVRDISWTEPAGTALVNRLVGLNLESRAEPIMARLVEQSTDPVRRFLLGARLASLRTTMNDATGTIAALSKTVPPAGQAMDPAVVTTRQLLYAHAEEERGNQDAALAILDTVHTPEADEMRADIHAARGDWARTISALTDLESKRILTAKLTDEQQALVMRLAVTATLGEDAATLKRVAQKYEVAMAKNGSFPLFRLLTSSPLRELGDLPRAFEEIQMARQLPLLLGTGQP